MPRLSAALAALALFASPAAAQDPQALVAKARELAAAGDSVGADAALEEARDIVWKAMPLGFRKILLVESAKGFGIYAPRAGSDYRNGDTMTVYLEPVGFGYGGDGLGNAQINLKVGVRILKEDGSALFDVPDFGEFVSASRSKGRDMFLTVILTFNATPIPVSDYKVELTITDKVTGKSATLTPIPFRITA